MQEKVDRCEEGCELKRIFGSVQVRSGKSGVLMVRSLVASARERGGRES